MTSPSSAEQEAARPPLLASAVLHALSAGSAVFLFVLLIIAGRVLGAEDFGRFSFAMAFVFLFDFLLDPGLYHYMIREMARDTGRASALLAHAMTWKLALSAPVFVVVAIALDIVDTEGGAFVPTLWMTAAHLLRSAKDSLRTPLLASERFDLDALTVCVERAGLLVVGVAVLWAGYGLIGLCIAFVGVRLLDVGFAIAIVRRTGCRTGLVLDPRATAKIVRAAAPIGVFYATLTLYNYVDTVMLQMLRGAEQVGWYNSGYRIYEGLLMLPGIVSMVLMPRLSVAWAQQSEDFDRLFARGLKYALLLGLIAGAQGAAVPTLAIGLAFGTDYAPAVPALRILMLGLGPVFALHLLQTTMIAMNRQHVLVRAAGAGLVLNAALNALLIPSYGLVAAAAVTVGVETCVLLGLMSTLRARMSARVLWSEIVRPVGLAALAVAAALLLVDESRPILRLVVLDVGGLAILWLGRVFDTNEIEQARQLVRRRREAAADGGS